MVVVDPGVGSSRRPILAEAGGHFFIAPDNGVLSMIYDAAAHKVRVISNPKLMAARSAAHFMAATFSLPPPRIWRRARPPHDSAN